MKFNNDKIDRIRNIRNEINDISGLVGNPSYPTNENRCIFFFTEIDTLMTILNFNEQRAYKECFILLRTVLEKFLFFWLMFEGKKYRWIAEYRIHQVISKNSKEARDETLKKWNQLKKERKPEFIDAIQIQPGKEDDNIIITYESEGIFRDTDINNRDEVIPITNFMLEQFKSDLAHLSDLSIVTTSRKQSDKLVKNAKRSYHNYFYIENVLRNLMANNLVNQFGLDKIKIHYNFLSKYVHPHIASLKVWQNINTSYPSDRYDEETLSELVFLYVAKLMHLYIKIFVINYTKRIINGSEVSKYKKIIDELNTLSKDLWFFDNDPTEFDMNTSNSYKNYLRSSQCQIPNYTLYYTDPLERLQNMKKNFVT